MQPSTPVPAYQTVQTVPSESVNGLVYLVRTDAAGRTTCGCRGFLYRARCKHVAAIAAPAPVAVAPSEHSVNCDLYGFSGDCAVCS